MTTQQLQDATLTCLEARYGRALFRDRDAFYRPKGIGPRAINWSTVR